MKKRIFMRAWVLGLLFPAFASADTTSAPALSLRDDTPRAPVISKLDQSFLTRLARRCLAARLAGKEYEPPYVPSSLQDLRARLSVTLRRQGRLLGSGDSGELPVADGCKMAVEKALFASQRKKQLAVEDLPSITIEMELCGPRVRIGDATLSTQELSHRYDLGLDGIAAATGGREILIRPSQLISLEIFCENDEELDHRCNRYQTALDNLYEKLGLASDPPAQPAEQVAFSRFRTTHWVEPAPEADPVALVAGLTPIGIETITRDGLLSVVDDLARYIRYRQTTDGFFSYEFLPGRDMYWPQQNWVRQAATIWALAHHARIRGNAASAESLDRALSGFAKMIQPLEGVKRAAFLSTPDDQNPLGATALVALAMMDAPQPERYAEKAQSLVTALAAMQRVDGSFRTSFPPASSEGSQDYFPGEALLAIARMYAGAREASLREVCDRALPFYQAYFRKNRPPMFVPWQLQAWGQLARSTQLRKYADFAFELGDFLLPRQIQGVQGEEAIYNGGFDVHGTGRAGIASAVYVEGLVDAKRTADAFHDVARSSRYEDAIRQACRFIVQLRFRPEEAFYVQSPQDVIGGMRDTPADPTLRIDHTQHALSALLGAVEVGAASKPGG